MREKKDGKFSARIISAPRLNEGSLFCQVIFPWVFFLIFPNSPIVFFDVRRKIVRPVIFRNEIKIRNGSRMNGGEKGLSAGITDGGGGKSGKEISVIRCGSH